MLGQIFYWELQHLIADVQSGSADYNVILVLDVTRWGRFQDADESAYYEYLCRRAGIDVQYVAEQFENDGSPVSTIVKGVKRAMAGENSRELSGKVFAGQCRLIEMGFRQGGPAGYGLRRVLVDEHRQPKGTLKRGEHKSLQTDRVVLVAGPDEEVETVRWIYRAFTEEGLQESEIAGRLKMAHAQNERYPLLGDFPMFEEPCVFAEKLKAFLDQESAALARKTSPRAVPQKTSPSVTL